MNDSSTDFIPTPFPHKQEVEKSIEYLLPELRKYIYTAFENYFKNDNTTNWWTIIVDNLPDMYEKGKYYELRNKKDRMKSLDLSACFDILTSDRYRTKKSRKNSNEVSRIPVFDKPTPLKYLKTDLVYAVKNGARNPSAHITIDYTEDEVQRILASVIELAQLLGAKKKADMILSIRKTYMKITLGSFSDPQRDTASQMNSGLDNTTNTCNMESTNTVTIRKEDFDRIIKDKLDNLIASISRGEEIADNKESHNTHLRLIKKKAEAGDPFSMNDLGDMYYSGIEVKQDLDLAELWYLKSAEKGLTKAVLSLGLLHDEDNGKLPDAEKAFYWYNKAAEMGDTQGYRYAAWYYYYGKCTTQSYEKAITYWKKAADMGEPRSMCNLGNLYRDGNQGDPDYARA